MIDVQQLLEIAQDLEAREIIAGLLALQERQRQENAELIIPLIGEYSSGKTSLLNALTAGKKLETAATPTTAAIFEIYFSRSEEKALVFKDGGEPYELPVGELKNSEVSDARIVKIFDTSTKIPAATVLVDTPGISSPDAKHKETLIAYLPHADMVLVTVDINQGVTASIIRFITMAELAKRRIYVVITKCDEKPPSEQEALRKYIKDNTKLAIENIVCVSARDGKIDELLHLIDAIQKDKNAIVAEVTEQRLTLAGLELAAMVTDILASSKLSTDELDDRIADAKRQDAEITKRIRRLVSDLERGVERLADDAARTFDRQITNSLESLAGSPPQGDINRMTQNTVNGTAQMTLCNFKDAILRELGRLSRNRRGGEDDVRLPLLTELECLDGVWQDMPYNIDLSLPDVQHINRNIAAGVKVAGAIGIGAAVVCTMGAAAPALAAGGAATAISGAAAVGGAIKVVDTATDIASVVSNHKMLKKIEAFSEAMQSGERAINDMDNRIGQAVPLVSGKQQGFLEGLIGQITEHALAKPQRQRLISDYLSQLRAEFRRRMEGVSEEVIAEIEQTLQAEADGKRRALEDSLTRLKDERETQKSEFEARMKRLASYKQLLPAALPAGYIDFNRKGEKGAQRVSLGAPL